jgi:hypothetical protein
VKCAPRGQQVPAVDDAAEPPTLPEAFTQTRTAAGFSRRATMSRGRSLRLVEVGEQTLLELVAVDTVRVEREGGQQLE